MADKPKEGETAPAPEKSKVESLTEAVEQLVKLKVAEASQPKPTEIPPTDPNTRPKFSDAPGEVVTDEAALTDERFSTYKQTKSINPASGVIEVSRKGGWTQPLGYEDRKSINIASFPRGDYDNFSLARYAFAKQRAHHLGTDPRKDAPWESMYYDALGKVVYTDPVTKAQGDQVSGQDGGFLAP